MKWQAIVGSVLAHASALAWIGTTEGQALGGDVVVQEFAVLEAVTLDLEPTPEPPAPETPPEPEAPPPEVAKPAPVPKRPSAPTSSPSKPAPEPSTPARPRKLKLTMSNSGSSGGGGTGSQGGGTGGAGAGGSGSGSGSASGPPAEDDCQTKISKPAAKTKAPIRYPEGARAQGVQGRVVLRAHIDTQGKVTRVEVLESPSPLLDEPVQRALEKWTFEPGRRCGQPVATTFKLDRRFELEG